MLPHWVRFPFGIRCKIASSACYMITLCTGYVLVVAYDHTHTHTHTAPIISAMFSSCNKLLRAMKSGRWRPKSQPKLKPNRNLIHTQIHRHTHTHALNTPDNSRLLLAVSCCRPRRKNLLTCCAVGKLEICLENNQTCKLFLSL